MNSFDKILALSFVVWAIISVLIVFIKGGSFFADDRLNGYQIIKKYSPRWWRVCSIVFNCVWVVALVYSLIMKLKRQ